MFKKRKFECSQKQKSVKDFFSKNDDINKSVPSSFAKISTNLTKKPIATVLPQRFPALSANDFILLDDSDEDLNDFKTVSSVSKLKSLPSASLKHSPKRILSDGQRFIKEEDESDEDNKDPQRVKNKRKINLIQSSEDEEDVDEIKNLENSIEIFTPIKEFKFKKSKLSKKSELDIYENLEDKTVNNKYFEPDPKLRDESKSKNKDDDYGDGFFLGSELLDVKNEENEDSSYFATSPLSPPPLDLNSFTKNEEISPVKKENSDINMIYNENANSSRSGDSKFLSQIKNDIDLQPPPKDTYCHKSIPTPISAGIKVDEILKHPLLRKCSLSEKDSFELKSYQKDVADAMIELFTSFTLDMLRQISDYDAIHHLKLTNAFKKIRNALEKYKDSVVPSVPQDSTNKKNSITDCNEEKRHSISDYNEEEKETENQIRQRQSTEDFEASMKSMYPNWSDESNDSSPSAESVPKPAPIKPKSFLFKKIIQNKCRESISEMSTLSSHSDNMDNSLNFVTANFKDSASNFSSNLNELKSMSSKCKYESELMDDSLINLGDMNASIMSVPLDSSVNSGRKSPVLNRPRIISTKEAEEKNKLSFLSRKSFDVIQINSSPVVQPIVSKPILPPPIKHANDVKPVITYEDFEDDDVPLNAAYAVGGECKEDSQSQLTVSQLTQSRSKSPSKCSGRFKGNAKNDGITGEFSGDDYPHSQEMTNIFRQVFGLRHFRENQKEVINASLTNKDCFVLMPTGGGKSLCYQLPACVKNGITVVISPLKSLILDQVQKLSSLDIPAGNLSGDISASEENHIYTELSKREPGLKLLYVTPEKICASQKVVSMLKSLFQRDKLGLFVIDEAHCVSQWGHDFRPDYKRLNTLKIQFGSVPMMALTATATPRVRMDILHQLGMIQPKWFMSSFNRKNLHYEVLPKKGKNITTELSELIFKKYKNQCGIVYCLSRKECDEVAAAMKKSGISAISYHAGLSDVKRVEVQNKWINDKIKVVVATIAFGMGIDKPDVRFVVHYCLPKSIEGYYQESGRAGRDNELSHCILFYSYNDMHRLRKMIDMDKENWDAKKTHYDNLFRIVAYCNNRTDCRRSQILNYFGEIFNREHCKSNPKASCDNCKDVNCFQNIDVTKECRAILTAAQQICSGRGWGSNFTVNHFVDVFKGSEAKKIVENKHNKIPMHAMGKKWQRGDCERLMQRLILEGLLSEDYVVYGDITNAYLRLGNKGKAFLQCSKNYTFEIKKDSLGVPGQSKNEVVEEDTELDALVENCHKALLDAVKELAFERGITYTNIINMVALRQMSSLMPETEEEMRNIPHVTKANFDKYGKVLLGITQRFAAEKLIMFSDRDDAMEDGWNGTDGGDEDDNFLGGIEAPEQNHSPYFNSGSTGRFRGRGRSKFRRRGRGKRRSASRGKYSSTSRGSSTASRGGNSSTSRGTSSSVGSGLRLLSMPKPRSFLPPIKVFKRE